MAPNTREGNLLLDRETDVGTVHHERQVIERRRQQGVGKRGDNGRSGLTSSDTGPSRFDFVSSLSRDPDDVCKGER